MIINRSRNNKVPQLNTTSTADISFMLLIFFLVTTSMDVDKGLQRMLPPADKNKKEQTVTNVEKDNLMTLILQTDNTLLLNGQPERVARLKADVVDFITKRGEKHLITLESDREANYDTYFKIQNQLVAAYAEVKDRKAQQLYHHTYASLSAGQKMQIDSLCPQRIAESYANATRYSSALDSINARMAAEEGGAVR